MPAEQDKRGDVPAHNKYTNGNTHDGCADRIHVSQVFRCQEERISAKALHKSTIHHAEHQYPKQDKDLVFPEMKKKQL